MWSEPTGKDLISTQCLSRTTRGAPGGHQFPWLLRLLQLHWAVEGPLSSGAALCQLTQQSFSTDGGQLLNAASLMITSTGTTRLISRGCSLAPLTAEQHWLPVIKHGQLLESCVCACEAQVRGGGSVEASTSWKLFTRSTLRQMFDASG